MNVKKYSMQSKLYSINKLHSQTLPSLKYYRTNNYFCCEGLDTNNSALENDGNMASLGLPVMSAVSSAV
jgi:hypothetical protein